MLTRALVAGLRPSASISALPAAAGAAALASLPVAYFAVRGWSIDEPLLVLVLVIGAALGLAADDPAADLLRSMPATPIMRLGLRLACLLMVVGPVLAVVLASVAAGPGLPVALVDRVPESLAAASIGVATGVVLANRRERGAGAMGVTAGLFAPLIIAGLAFRWPARFPGLAPGPTHQWWWAVTAAAVAVLARALRDPARS